MPRRTLPALIPSALEFRVALRRLAARPLATCAVLLSLTLGLALVSLVLSVSDRLLLRPLPGVEQSADLVVIERTTQDPRGGNTSLSWLDFLALRSAFEQTPEVDVAAFYATRLGLASSLDAGTQLGTRRIDAVVHSDGYGDTLGVVPLLGRWPRDQAAGIAEADDDGSGDTGSGLEVALGHRLWTDLGRPDALGSLLRLQGHSVLVVGVLPAGFVGTDHSHQPQAWVPISTFEHLATGIDGQFAAKRDDKAWLQVVSRFGSTAVVPDGQLESLRNELARARPEAWKDRGLAAVPLVHRAFGGAERRAALERHLSLLLVALGCAFVVAYANAAGLVAIRTADREGEWQLRAALGAGRSRLVAAASLEGLLLGVGALVAAPACGVLLWPLIRHLRLPDDALVDVAFDPRQIAPVLLLGALGALVLAATPALTLAVRRRMDGTGSARSGSLARQLLVAAQVALAFVALGAAIQLVQTVNAYRQVDPGVSADASDGLLAVGLDVGAAGHDGAHALDAFRQIDHRLRAVPGVDGASLAATLPILDSGPMVNLTIEAEGADSPPSGEHHVALHALVGSGYFSTVGRALLEGRDFSPFDDAAASPVLIVNRTLAERLWGERTALGRQIRLVAAQDPYTVVGVVEDGLYAGLRDTAQPTLYMAHAQSGRSMIATSLATSATVLVRLGGAPSSRLLRDVRAAVAAVDPAVPVLWIRPLRQLINDHFAIERQIASILVAVASALLLFCLLGVYGGLAHSFVHQRGELAVRTALGARRRHLMARLAAPTGRSLLLGLLAGVLLVAPTSALLDRLVFGIEAGSPASWLAAAGVLLGAVVLAGVDPVRGVLTLETAAMLREE